MKRFAIVIGLILLFAPGAVYAAPTAVSPYVQQVLNRAEEGIVFAKEGSSV